MGCRARHDTAIAASCGVAGSAGTAVARSPAAGQETRARDRIQPWQSQPAPALCELIAATRATLAALQETGKRVADLAGIAAERWRAQLGHYLPLIERILTQSQRRVIDGQTVKASEKLVSL